MTGDELRNGKPYAVVQVEGRAKVFES